MSVSNFAKNTLQSAIGSGATSIDIDTATSPYNNMPSSGRGFLKDSLDSPTKWEEITWTGRSAITGGYTLTGVTRKVDSNTGSAQSFDAGHFITQDPSGTNKVVTDEAQTFTALQTFSSGINLGDENLTKYDEGTWTPVLKGTTTAGSHTYTVQEGYYTRIGDIVFWYCYVIVGTKDTGWAGSLHLGGFPFTASSNAEASYGAVPTIMDDITFANNLPTFHLAGTELRIRDADYTAGGSPSTLSVSDTGTNPQIRASGHYKAA